MMSLFSKRAKPDAVEGFDPRDKARYEGTLIAHGLSKTYDSRRVVNGVSLVVRRGEAVGLLGPQRCRKDHVRLHDHRSCRCR